MRSLSLLFPIFSARKEVYSSLQVHAIRDCLFSFRAVLLGRLESGSAMPGMKKQTMNCFHRLPAELFSLRF